MERSRLASPLPSLCDPERHEDGTTPSPSKLSRPQKRRRRADRQAVKEALISTYSLKSKLADENFIAPSMPSWGTCIDQTSIPSRLLAIESKLDYILCIMAPSYCQVKGDSIPTGQTNQFIEEQISTVLHCLNPAAHEFVPHAAYQPAADSTCSQLPDEPKAEENMLKSLETRIVCLENHFDELQADESSAGQDDIVAVCRDLEERLDLEMSRLRSQVDDDYSQCAKSIAALDAKLQRLPADVIQASTPQADKTKSIDLNIDLGSFSPTQKGLFKQIGGQLNRLVADRRRKRLEELRRNLANQEDGAFKQQQSQVLDVLERQLNI